MKDVFLSSWATNPEGWTRELHDELGRIAGSIAADLTPPGGRGYFSLEAQRAIAREAAARLESRVREAGVSSPAALREAWREVVVDFHRNAYWGHGTISRPEAPPLTEQQKVTRELLPYIGVVLTSAFVLKVAVTFFGIRYSNEPNDGKLWGLLVALMLMVFSAVNFVWRQRARGKGIKKDD